MLYKKLFDINASRIFHKFSQTYDENDSYLWAKRVRP
jgi:hypothetical protein